MCVSQAYKLGRHRGCTSESGVLMNTEALSFIDHVATNSTIEVLKVLLVLNLLIPLLLCVALLSLNLLAACTCRWGPGASESTSPVNS
jgi:hypothetical protein